MAKKHHNSQLYKKVKWITGHKTVLTDNFDEFGIKNISIETETIFARPRLKIKDFFSPPHILIKESLGENQIPIAFSNEYLCFTNRIVGIHAPKNEHDELINLFNRLKNNNQTYRFYPQSKSGQVGVTLSNSILMQKIFLIYPTQRTN